MSDAFFRPLNVGNTADDDAQVFEAMYEEAPTPPKPVVEPISTPTLPDPPIPTKLTSVRQSVDPLWTSPTLILPRDTRRTFLSIRCLSPAGTATDGVVVTSGKVGSATGLAVLPHGGILPLDNHTGAIYVLAVGAAPVFVDVWSVTR